MYTDAVYNDLFTGEAVRVRIRGDGMTPASRFWALANYRPATGRRRCENCENRCFAVKCKKIGLTEATATNIELGHVCNYHRLARVGRTKKAKAIRDREFGREEW
jgi:hypothetical protein